MPGTVGNFITTILLTLTCSTILFITYRHALRPILVKHNLIPLKNLPRALSDTFSSQGRVRLEDDDNREVHSRDLEEGFRDDSDDEAEAPVGDDRIRREPRQSTSD
ncbi:hypothetical protein L873DRAFT_1681490 [Choiromyces venosus 120613-1]|uniref:Uncharacterized protein n=1 Tax=Choiromyces venosus 120613-1 TaxID=1336337 RepID=A0A3N4JPG8_9PEZI|nr:hypothetical protein L873DRAFT_1681490 [Choiromyces venosus 120613-1]